MARSDEKSHVSEGKTRKHQLWVSLLLLVIGVAGYFTLRGHWLFYGFAHTGAVGLIGLFGIAAGSIARIKGRDYNLAFWLGFLTPVVLGIAAVLVVRFAGGPGTPFYCGGSVSLAAAVLILISYSVVRKRPAVE